MNVRSQANPSLPRVFVFNPLVEARIAAGKGFFPTKHQAQLGRDLANLPQFLCRRYDVVLVPQRPAEHFLNGLEAAGFALPAFVEDVAALTDRKLGGLRPWAWGPDSVERLQPLFKNVTPNPRPASAYFNESLATLYSKAWSADFLAGVLAEQIEEPWLCSLDEVGVVSDNTEVTLHAVAAIRARGYHRVILKQAIGVAGSNALRLFEPELLAPQRRWIENTHAAGQSIVVEPWLERKLDFSIQLEMQSTGLKVCGYTGLINTPSGQFVANWAEPDFERSLPTAAIACFEQSQRIQELYASIFSRLEEKLRQIGFLGPVGIDALVCRDKAGAIRLKPVVEINPRYTMGRLTLELMRRVSPSSFGLFQLVSRAALKAAGKASFAAFAQLAVAQSPLHFEAASARRIQSGVICLNNPSTAGVCLAVLRVSERNTEIQCLINQLSSAASA